MKTTIKEFQNNVELRKELKNTAENAKYDQDYQTAYELNTKIEELNKNYFDKLPTVPVSFLIGSRSYYEEVVKIGKALFNNGRKMTKSRGYYCVKEIDQITEQMQKSMLADSYYY